MSAAGPPHPPAGGGSGDDPFSWLYRRGEAAPSEDEPPLVPPTVEQPAVTPAPVRAATPPPQPTAVAPAQPLPPPPQAAPAATYQQPPGRPPVSYPPAARPPAPRTGPRPRVVVAVVVAVLLVAAIAAGVVVAFVLRSPDRQRLDPAAAPSTRPSASAEAKPVVKPVASGVRADCTAPPAADDAGNRVTYGAGNVLDGASSTAWRCDGDGIGHSLTFTFPAGSTIGSVGLINGYAKTDPRTGAKRYREYRRITRARWTFDDGTTISQQLVDGDVKLQTMAVPAHRAQTVKLTIEASSRPGTGARSRDAVLISGVAFG